MKTNQISIACVMETILFLVVTLICTMVFNEQHFFAILTLTTIVSVAGVWVARNYPNLEQKMYGCIALALFVSAIYFIPTGWKDAKLEIIIVLIISSTGGGLIQHLIFVFGQKKN